MITVQQFMDDVDKNVARVKEYQLGHDGSDGKCDCVGLIIGALRLAGVKYDGIHGSNWFARHNTDNLQKLVGSSQLQVGDVVYKCRPPGSKGYKLPERYAKDPDQNDYYHIGVVKSVYPLCIVHCTSPGAAIHYDSSIGKWAYFGRVRGVLYYEGENKMDQATVVGGGLNLRKAPDAHSDRIVQIPTGSVVTVLEKLPGWDKIQYQGFEGYVMSQFLDQTEQTEVVSVDRAELEKIYDTIGDWLGLRG